VSDKWLILFAVFVLTLIFLLAIDPSLFLLVSPALVVSGYYVWKKGETSTYRAVGLAALTIGIVIAVALILSMPVSIESTSGARIYK